MASAAPTGGSSSRGGSGGATTVQAHAQGSGGVDELASNLSKDHVQFGIMRFKFGTGTFQRVKFLSLQFVGENVGGVKRGRMLAKKGAALKDLGATHASFHIDEIEECTVDNILEQVAKVFIGDDDIKKGGGESFSISKMKEDYEAMLAEAKKEAEAFAERRGSGTLTRKTAAEMGKDFVSGEKALKSVHEDVGAFNWALFKPHKSHAKLHNAGSLGVTEMVKWLPENEVLYGILRMGFGAGKWRRTKRLFVHWSGEATSAVKRGQGNALKGAMHKLLAPAHLDFEATDLDQLSLKHVIEVVKKNVVVDGDTSGDSAVDPFTVENYMKALEEEAKASAAMFGDSGDLNGGEGDTLSASQIINLVRQDKGPFTWALFNVKA